MHGSQLDPIYCMLNGRQLALTNTVLWEQDSGLTVEGGGGDQRSQPRGKETGHKRTPGTQPSSGDPTVSNCWQVLE